MGDSPGESECVKQKKTTTRNEKNCDKSDLKQRNSSYAPEK